MTRWIVVFVVAAVLSGPASGADGSPKELVEQLRTGDAGARISASEAVLKLGNIGKPSKETLPELREMAEKDPEARVRDWVTEAVKKIEAAK